MKVKLSDIAEFKNGINFNKVDNGQFIKCIGVGDFGGISVIDNFDNISMICVDKIINDDYYLKDNDILFVRSNGNKELVGRSMIVFPKDNKIVCSGFCIRMRITSSQILPMYLYFLMNSPTYKQQFSKTQQTSINNLNQSILGELIIDIPAMSEQKKIVGLLSALTEKIRINNKINMLLQNQASMLYDYWFTQFDFPDKNNNPYKSSGGKMVWNEELKREIPLSWEVKPVKELLNVITGREDANFSSSNGQYKFFTCSKEPLLCDSYVFEGKAVLIAGNGDFNVKHYSGKFNAYQRTYVLMPDEKKYYGAIYLAAIRLIDKFKSASNGSIVKFITKGDIENILITIPDDDLYFETINNIIDTIESNQKENEDLVKVRDWLLPMFMNGQATILD